MKIRRFLQAAALAFAFDPSSAGTDGPAFTRRWSEQHYGSASADAVAAVHTEFEELSADAMSDYAVVIAVQNLADAMREIALRGSFNFSSLHASAAATQKSAAATTEKWRQLSQKAEQVLASLPPRVQQTFVSHSLAQQYLLGNGTAAFERLATAALAVSVEAAVSAVEQAAATMEEGCDALRLGEGNGHWRGYFAHDRLDDFQHSRRLLLQLVAVLGNRTVRPTRPICSCTGGVHNCSGSIPYANCPDMFSNQLPPAYSGDAYPLLYRSADPSLNFDGVVRGGCTGACRTMPSGGIMTIHGGVASVWLALPRGVVSSATIRYTLDGSTPAPSSARYVSPLPLRGNVTVAARAFGLPAGVATPPSVFKYFSL